MRLYVIPTRDVSKRIPRNNVRDFCDKPIIAYAIEAAMILNLFDSIIFTTDYSNIESVSTTYGPNRPFMRPNELANDLQARLK
jgi:N-acylneuraminate cytidylyltransferase